MFKSFKRKDIKQMKTAVIYWSGTGNTQAMAQAVLEGMEQAGAEAVILTPDQVDVSQISAFDAVALGCPAMGAEELEDSEFEPMYQVIKGYLAGKKVALFGSYGWGDGEWMRNWEDDCKANGIVLAAESVMANETPDDESLQVCRNLGSVLAS